MLFYPILSSYGFPHLLPVDGDVNTAEGDGTMSSSSYQDTKPAESHPFFSHRQQQTSLDGSVTVEEKNMDSVIEEFQKSYLVQSHPEIMSGMTTSSSFSTWNNINHETIGETRFGNVTDSISDVSLKEDQPLIKRDSNWLKRWTTKNNKNKRIQQQSVKTNNEMNDDMVLVADDDYTIWKDEDRLVYKQCNIVAYIKSHGKINHYCGTLTISIFYLSPFNVVIVLNR
jgi:hypothetical protein